MYLILALLLYILSVRLIGVPWARLRWNQWERAMHGYNTGRTLDIFLFPLVGIDGYVGSKQHPDPFGLAISIAYWHSGRDVWQCKRVESRRRALQIQAFLWPVTLLWSIVAFPSILIAMVLFLVIMIILVEVPYAEEVSSGIYRLWQYFTGTTDAEIGEPGTSMFKDQPFTTAEGCEFT